MSKGDRPGRDSRVSSSRVSSSRASRVSEWHLSGIVMMKCPGTSLQERKSPTLRDISVKIVYQKNILFGKIVWLKIYITKYIYKFSFRYRSNS